MGKFGTNKIIGFAILILQLVLVFVFITWDSTKSPLLSFMESDKQLEEVPYLHVKEVVYVTETIDSEEVEVVLPVEPVLFEYVEVMDGCGAHFEGECLLVRGGPGIDFPVASRLRNGMVLKVGGKVQRGTMTWYKIVFDEWLRYPERLTSDWYVSADYVRILLDEGTKILGKDNLLSNKKIIVDRSEQMLTAYNGDILFMEASISTGLVLTPTPRGTFKIYKKMPSRYMQGPLPNLNDKQYYDLPGVPWNLYFTNGGAVIHGAYWHENFGSQYSHGCVNLPPKTARNLYTWTDLGTTVIVQD